MSGKAEMRLVVIGASAGGIAAIGKLLNELPDDFPWAVAIVQHMKAGTPWEPGLLFGGARVREAADKDLLVPGKFFVAPPGYHLLVERDGTLSLSVDEPVAYSRPSIDVLFESAAESYGSRLYAALLSGANDDGAKGVARAAALGGVTFVQDPASAESPIMPRAALAAVTPTYILDPGAIGRRLADLAREVTR